MAIVAGIILSPWFFLVLPLHVVPLIVKSVKLFIMATNMGIKKERWSAFYSVPASYLVNIPNMLGFFYGFIRPYDKSEIKKPISREIVKKKSQ